MSVFDEVTFKANITVRALYLFLAYFLKVTRTWNITVGRHIVEGSSTFKLRPDCEFETHRLQARYIIRSSLSTWPYKFFDGDRDEVKNWWQ